MKNLFQEGPLWEDQNAFNIYRINIQSKDSGVTQVAQYKDEVLTPNVPPDGTRLNFTFSAVQHIPMIEETEITDPNGVVIVEAAGIDTNPVSLKVKQGAAIVTGTLDRTTGIASLQYTAGNAPPAGNFIVTYNAITIDRKTALGYRYAPAMWCYFRSEPDTETRVVQLLNALVPGWNFYSVILNESQGGGCTAGNHDILTSGEAWTTYAHESGHLVGGLCDEYTVWNSNHPPTEPSCVNATINDCSNRNTLKWVDFLDPNTPCPNTPFNSGTMDEAETVGHFEGADYYTKNAWRPAHNGRMNWNVHAFGPVSYNHIKNALDVPYHEHNFAETYVGDFTGDGRSDFVIHNANALELYVSDGSHMMPKWIQALPLGVWGDFSDHDQFLVGDFDGNGRDDLVVYNMVDSTIPHLALLISKDPNNPDDPNDPRTGFGFKAVIRYDQTLPGWGDMKQSDRFYVGDFDGDGKADLYVVNTALVDWPMGYLEMLRSTGSALAYVVRYDDVLPGWDRMMPGDQFFVANIDGSGGKDLYVINNTDWCCGYLLSLLSTGTGLVKGARYDQVIPGWANFLPGDQYLVGDFAGNGKEGLYSFNAADWPQPYLGVLRSLGTGVLDVPILHEGSVEGWGALKPHDRFLVANVNGIGGSDLYVANAEDWSEKYLGRLVATQSGFQGSWQSNQIGKWKLASDDVYHVVNYAGATGASALDDLVAHIDPDGNEFLGLLSNDGVSLGGPVIYWKWIHHFRYHATGYW